MAGGSRRGHVRGRGRDDMEGVGVAREWVWSCERERVWQHGGSGCGRREWVWSHERERAWQHEGVGMVTDEVGMTRCRKEWVWPQRCGNSQWTLTWVWQWRYTLPWNGHSQRV